VIALLLLTVVNVSRWQDEAESFRAEFTLMERTSVHAANAEAVSTLDLSDAKLRFIDMSPYTGLQKLR
jgi:hypothetical protein